MRKLSVCVPTFNRAKELDALLSSIPESSDVEVVVCDDGSQDATKDLVDAHRSRLDLKYLYQANAGRASALVSAIKAAEGQYVVLMDSDDHFTPNGLHAVLTSMDEFPDVDAFVFGVRIRRNGHEYENIPPDTIANFVSLRADFGVRGDLKEVVRTDLLKRCLYEVRENVRRVPTYLLWSQVAEHAQCRCVATAVAVKEYLPGGLTANILFNKTKYADPMVLLFERLSTTSTYSSHLYRWRSRVQWARYAYHSAEPVCLDAWWKWLVIAPAYGLYLGDLLRLKQRGRR
jgi:glycosyltransferase involved in cell wall biosynthesis